MHHRLTALAGALLTSFFVLAGSAQAAAPGLNVSDYTDTQAALDQGAKQVRFFVRWSDFEATGPGDFDATGPKQADRFFSEGLRRGVGLARRAGATPIMSVLGAPAWAASGKRPRSAGEYATFVGELAAWLAPPAGQPASVIEIWNEPDAPEFWGEEPNAAFYTSMLKASHLAIKQADPGALVLTGPTTGNNYDWIEALYANGAKGSFDGVSVHTDTACSVAGPDVFYRGPSGRLGQFTFLGYREVRASMLANGDDKPIWMSELGWTTTNGGPTSCESGAGRGSKPSGVNERDQAAFLRKAFHCLANDPYVVAGTVFTLRDVAGASPGAALGNYGLFRRDGSAKPALDAFKAAGGLGPTECGDFEPPALTVTSPVEGQQFTDALDLRASAADGGVGLARISYAFDGGQPVRNFTDGLVNGSSVTLLPWLGSRSLSLGAHTIEVTALDANGNTMRQSVPVVKVAPGTLKASLVPTIRLPRKVTCKRRSCSLKASLGRPAGAPSFSGKVAVEWQWRNTKGKYRKLVGGLKDARKPFTFTAKLRKAGRWRVRVSYPGVAPYRAVTSKFLLFRVR